MKTETKDMILDVVYYVAAFSHYETIKFVEAIYGTTFLRKWETVGGRWSEPTQEKIYTHETIYTTEAEAATHCLKYHERSARELRKKIKAMSPEAKKCQP
jgi:hypothetical protein